MPQRLALPLRVANGGGLVTLVQDSPAEVAQSVALLLATRPGERRSVPDYGTDDPLFSGLSEEEVSAAIELWEDRADPATVHITTTGVDQHADVYPATSTDDEVYA